MKKYFKTYLLGLMVLLAGACGRERLHIHGNIEGYEGGGTAYLRAYEGALRTIDSTWIVEGRFSFDLPEILPNILYIQFSDYPYFYIPVFIEGSEVFVSGSINHSDAMRVSGSPANDQLTGYRQSVRSYEIMLQAIEMQLENNENRADSLLYAGLKAKQDSIYRLIVGGRREFIRENPSSLVSAFFATTLIKSDDGPAQIDSLIMMLDPVMPDNAFIRRLNRKRGEAANNLSR